MTTDTDLQNLAAQIDETRRRASDVSHDTAQASRCCSVDTDAHGLGTAQHGHVVEVGRALGSVATEVWDGHQPTAGPRRLGCLGQARV
ncbi:MAG: hypothetical protein ACREX8_14015, partial [Gammaproteobacteria bacterium]